MSDPTFAPSAPPPVEEEPLREFFAHQIRQEDRETLSRLCRSLLHLTREAAPIYSAEIQAGTLLHEVAALAADLRFVEAALRQVCGPAEGDLYRWESRLVAAAEKLPSQVGALASELESEVAAAREANPEARFLPSEEASRPSQA